MHIELGIFELPLWMKAHLLNLRLLAVWVIGHFLDAINLIQEGVDLSVVHQINLIDVTELIL